MITSPTNQWLKRARALLTRKGRKREGAFLVEGPRALDTVVRAGAEVEVVLRETIAADHPALSEALEAAGLRPEAVAPGLLGIIGNVETPQGWLAIVRTPERAVAPDESPDRLVILDRLADPGNVGTILRTADAVGASVALLDGCADPLSPKVVRASAGSVVRVSWWRDTYADVAARLVAKGVGVVVLDAAANESLLDLSLSLPLALVAGSEAHGTDREWPGAQFARLPMRSGAESLNVAIATAVALYRTVGH